jgi:hypothetical protein
VQTEPPESPVGPWLRAASLVYTVLFVFLYGSAFAAFLFESEVAALLVLGGFVGTLTFHLVSAVIVYRETMRREWPKVEPLADDDDWDAA